MQSVLWKISNTIAIVIYDSGIIFTFLILLLRNVVIVLYSQKDINNNNNNTNTGGKNEFISFYFQSLATQREIHK